MISPGNPAIVDALVDAHSLLTIFEAMTYAEACMIAHSGASWRS
jgi:hypothetical protein